MPIHFPTILVISVAALLFGIRCGLRAVRDPDVDLANIHRKMRSLVPIACLFSGSIVAIALLHWPRSAIVWVPIPIQLLAPTVLWFIALPQICFLLALASVVAQRTGNPRRYTLAGGAIIVPSILLGNIALLHQPIASELTLRSQRGVILQSSGSSCAAATVANLDRLRGGTLTEAEAAELLGTTRRGTSTAQIYAGLEELDFAPRVRVDAVVADIISPAVLIVDHVDTGTESHAIALVAAREDEFETWDPLKGRVLLSRDDLEKIWHGMAIECIGARPQRDTTR